MISRYQKLRNKKGKDEYKRPYTAHGYIRSFLMEISSAGDCGDIGILQPRERGRVCHGVFVPGIGEMIFLIVERQRVGIGVIHLIKIIRGFFQGDFLAHSGHQFRIGGGAGNIIHKNVPVIGDDLADQQIIGDFLDRFSRIVDDHFSEIIFRGTIKNQKCGLIKKEHQYLLH